VLCKGYRAQVRNPWPVGHATGAGHVTDSSQKYIGVGIFQGGAYVFRDGFLIAEVIGVHFYLADRTGRLASGGLTNSHWVEFEAVRPKDRQGGHAVAIRRLRRVWQRE